MSKVSLLGDVEVVGAVILGKDHDEYPQNPGPGTLILKDNGVEVYTEIDGVMTWFPLSIPSNTYVHVQAAAALEWTVNHQLGVDDIWFQAQAVDGSPIYPQYQHVDQNSFKLIFTEATAGKVVVVGTADLNVPNIRTNEIQVGDANDVQIVPSGITIGGPNGVVISPAGITLAGEEIGGGEGSEFDPTEIEADIAALGGRVGTLESQMDNVISDTATALQTAQNLQSQVGNIDGLYGDVANLFATSNSHEQEIIRLGQAHALNVVPVNAGVAQIALNDLPSTNWRLTVAQALALQISGWPGAYLGQVMLELINGAAFGITWPSIRWIKSDGTYTTNFASNEVTLQSSGSDFILLWSRDGGATIYGKVVR